MGLPTKFVYQKKVPVNMGHIKHSNTVSKVPTAMTERLTLSRLTRQANELIFHLLFMILYILFEYIKLCFVTIYSYLLYCIYQFAVNKLAESVARKR